MHLTPIPLPAEINSNHMYVFLTVFLLTDHVRFCALVTPALRCRLSCPVFEYCFVFPVGLLFIKERLGYLRNPRSLKEGTET